VLRTNIQANEVAGGLDVECVEKNKLWLKSRILPLSALACVKWTSTARFRPLSGSFGEYVSGLLVRVDPVR
jgi:hypothetical protein